MPLKISGGKFPSCPPTWLQAWYLPQHVTSNVWTCHIISAQVCGNLLISTSISLWADVSQYKRQAVARYSPNWLDFTRAYVVAFRVPVSFSSYKSPKQSKRRWSTYVVENSARISMTVLICSHSFQLGCIIFLFLVSFHFVSVAKPRFVTIFSPESIQALPWF